MFPVFLGEGISDPAVDADGDAMAPIVQPDGWFLQSLLVGLKLLLVHPRPRVLACLSFLDQ
jgi:hypothetical protein